MPAYRYQDYINPLVGRIADSLGSSNDAKARGIANAGQATARGQELSGLAWSRAAQDVGQSVAGSVEREQDPRYKMEQIALEDAQQRRAGQQRMDQVVQPYQPNGPQPEGEGAAATQHPYLDQNGLYDIPKLTEVLASSGMAHLAPDLVKGAEAINGSILQHQQYQAKLDETNTVLVGDMAYGVLHLKNAGMPITQAIDLATAPGLATQRFSQQQVAQIKAQLVQLPPEQQDAALSHFMDAAAQVTGPKTLADGAQEVDRYKRTIAENVKAEKPAQPTTASLAVAAASGDPAAQRALELLKPEKPVTEPKQYEVTVPGPGGKPLKKLVSEDDLKMGVASYEKPNEPKDKTASDNIRLDKSYQYNSTQLEKERTPIAKKVTDVSDALSLLNQATPAADALVAPKILSVTAGGVGSGLRMNEAEISRILGGKNQWQSLKSKIDAWQLDPSKPFAITPDQRQQMRTILEAAQGKAQQKLSILDQAGQALVDTEDVTTHRNIIAKAKRDLDTLDQGGSDPRRLKAAQILQQNGRSSTPDAIDLFLKNNPSLK